MRILILIASILSVGAVKANPIKCEVSGDYTVAVTMDTPHPNHALMHRPSGETVWLQTSPDFIHKQMANFSSVRNWIINSESEGTIWVNGKATIQPIIKGKGKYNLYVAENTETERENTYFVECYFVIE
jgi:uncharacterized FlgJ-related protein